MPAPGAGDVTARYKKVVYDANAIETSFVELFLKMRRMTDVLLFPDHEVGIEPVSLVEFGAVCRWTGLGRSGRRSTTAQFTPLRLSPELEGCEGRPRARFARGASLLPPIVVL